MRRLCLTHWTERGEKVPAEPGASLCASCRDSEAERAHARVVATFYGGGGPSERERWEYAQDTGRRR